MEFPGLDCHVPQDEDESVCLQKSTKLFAKRAPKNGKATISVSTSS